MGLVKGGDYTSHNQRHLHPYTLSVAVRSALASASTLTHAVRPLSAAKISAVLPY